MADGGVELSTLVVAVKGDGIEAVDRQLATLEDRGDRIEREAPAWLGGLSTGARESIDRITELRSRVDGLGGGIGESISTARNELVRLSESISAIPRMHVLGPEEAQVIQEASQRIDASIRQIIAVEESAVREDERRDAAIRKLIGAEDAAIREEGQRQQAIRALIGVHEQAIAEDIRRTNSIRDLISAEHAAYAEDERRTQAIRRMALIQAEAIAMDQARTKALSGVTQEVSQFSRGLGVLTDQATRSHPNIAQLTSVIGELSPAMAAGVASAVAFGAAIVAIGVKATQMAIETDAAIRSITANLPEGTASVEGIGKAITDVAIQAGVARRDVVSAAQEIARLGVSSSDELRTRLELVQTLVDATGTNTRTAIQGLDQIMDAFGLTADEAFQSIARLAQAARGRVDFDSLFGAFQAATPRIHELGLTVNEATGAIIRLLDEGRSARQVATIFNEHDAAQIRAYASGVTLAADATQDLRTRAEQVQGSTERAAQRIREDLNKHLEDLGTHILPVVDKGLRGVLGVLDSFEKHPAIIERIGNAFLKLLPPGFGDALRAALTPPAQPVVATSVTTTPTVSARGRLEFEQAYGTGTDTTLGRRIEQQRALAAANQALADALTQLRQSIEPARSHLDQFDASVAKTIDHSKASADAIRQFREETDRLRIDALNRDLEQNARNLSETAKAADEVAARIARMGTLGVEGIGQLTTSTKEAVRQIGELLRQLKDTGAIRAPDISKDIDRSAEAVKKHLAYVNDLRAIWRDGFDKIITDGFKSFNDFFEDVLRLFSRLMQRMEQEGKNSGLGYQLLGFGSAAIGGGITGYNIGQRTDSQAAGFGAGAVGGAIAGAQVAGPWGAVIGGLTGAVGGLLGAADAQQRAAKAIEDAGKSLATNIASYVTNNPVAAALNRNDTQQEALRRQAEDLATERLRQAARHKSDEEALAAFDQLQKDLAAIDKANADNRKRIAQDFWDGISEQMNALRGPAGNLANTLAELERRYAENRASADALGGTADDLVAAIGKVTSLYNAQRDAAIAAYEQGQRQLDLALTARELYARGLSDEADAVRRRAEQEQELFAAEQAGWSEAQKARLRYIQGLETESVALQRAAQRMAELARITESWDVRRLRATGDDRGADLLAFQQQQAKEMQELLATLGRTTIPTELAKNSALIQQLMQLQADELKRFIADLDKRYGGGTTETTAPTGLVNVDPQFRQGRGEIEVIATASKALSEQTGNRMADYLLTLVRIAQDQLRALQTLAGLPVTPTRGTRTVAPVQSAPVAQTIQTVQAAQAIQPALAFDSGELARVLGSSLGTSLGTTLDATLRDVLRPLPASIPEPRFDVGALDRWNASLPTPPQQQPIARPTLGTGSVTVSISINIAPTPGTDARSIAREVRHELESPELVRTLTTRIEEQMYKDQIAEQRRNGDTLTNG